MGSHTSRPGVIQLCGGGIDNKDITDDVVDMEHNAINELSEELGIDRYDKQTVESFAPAYLKFGGPTGKMSVVYAVRLKQSSEEFLRSYEKFVEELKAAGEEPEFGKIFCLDIDKKVLDNFVADHRGMLDEYMEILFQTIGATAAEPAGSAA